MRRGGGAEGDSRTGRLVGHGGSHPPAGPELSAEADLIWAAYRAMVVAETGRCRGGDEQTAAWERAASDFKAIGVPWQEAMARWRWAQALQQEGASRPYHFLLVIHLRCRMPLTSPGVESEELPR